MNPIAIDPAILLIIVCFLCFVTWWLGGNLGYNACYKQYGRRRHKIRISIYDLIAAYIRGESCDEPDFLGRNWANLEEKLDHA